MKIILQCLCLTACLVGVSTSFAQSVGSAGPKSLPIDEAALEKLPPSVRAQIRAKLSDALQDIAAKQRKIQANQPEPGSPADIQRKERFLNENAAEWSKLKVTGPLANPGSLFEEARITLRTSAAPETGNSPPGIAGDVVVKMVTSPPAEGFETSKIIKSGPEPLMIRGEKVRIQGTLGEKGGAAEVTIAGHSEVFCDNIKNARFKADFADGPVSLKLIVAKWSGASNDSLVCDLEPGDQSSVRDGGSCTLILPKKMRPDERLPGFMQITKDLFPQFTISANGLSGGKVTLSGDILSASVDADAYNRNDADGTGNGGSISVNTKYYVTGSFEAVGKNGGDISIKTLATRGLSISAIGQTYAPAPNSVPEVLKRLSRRTGTAHGDGGRVYLSLTHMPAEGWAGGIKIDVSGGNGHDAANPGENGENGGSAGAIIIEEGAMAPLPQTNNWRLLLSEGRIVPLAETSLLQSELIAKGGRGGLGAPLQQKRMPSDRRSPLWKVILGGAQNTIGDPKNDVLGNTREEVPFDESKTKGGKGGDGGHGGYIELPDRLRELAMQADSGEYAYKGENSAIVALNKKPILQISGGDGAEGGRAATYGGSFGLYAPSSWPLGSGSSGDGEPDLNKSGYWPPQTHGGDGGNGGAGGTVNGSVWGKNGKGGKGGEGGGEIYQIKFITEGGGRHHYEYTTLTKAGEGGTGGNSAGSMANAGENGRNGSSNLRLYEPSSPTKPAKVQSDTTSQQQLETTGGPGQPGKAGKGGGARELAERGKDGSDGQYMNLVRPDIKVTPVFPPISDEPLIAVDANRNGVIEFSEKDETSADKPFVFWCNDDHDYAKKGFMDPSPDPLPGSGEFYVQSTSGDGNYARDCDVPGVGYLKDLEDLARLSIDWGGGIVQGKSKPIVELTITEGSGSINIWPAIEEGGGQKYLTDVDVGLDQIEKSKALNASVIKLQAGSSVQLPEAFLTGKDGRIICLFEGSQVGTATISVKVKVNGQTTESLKPLYLRICEITDMYEQWSVDDVEPYPSGIQQDDTGNQKEPAKTATRLNRGPIYWPSGEQVPRDYILAVHGWNMNLDAKIEFGNVAFKRLWHLGFKGRFGVFNWPCFWVKKAATDLGEKLNNVIDIYNFNSSEENAWRSGMPLKELLGNRRGELASGSNPERVHLLAHSQGNVVAGEALRLLGPVSSSVTTYIASQAAITAKAWENSVPDEGFLKAKSAGAIAAHYPFERDASDPSPFGGLVTSNPHMISPDIMGHFPTGDSECYFAASVMPTATIYVNYFNEVDYALGPLVWKSNIKPDLFKGYVYRKETGFECRGRHLNVETNGPDNYEIFAHVITHYSSPLGAMPIGMMFGSRGCFKRGLDLQGVLGFTADAHDHSGQFNRVFPFAWRYWRRVILDCHVDKDTPLARQ